MIFQIYPLLQLRAVVCFLNAVVFVVVEFSILENHHKKAPRATGLISHSPEPPGIFNLTINDLSHRNAGIRRQQALPRKMNHLRTFVLYSRTRPMAVWGGRYVSTSGKKNTVQVRRASWLCRRTQPIEYYYTQGRTWTDRGGDGWMDRHQERDT